MKRSWLGHLKMVSRLENNFFTGKFPNLMGMRYNDYNKGWALRKKGVRFLWETYS